jgi:serine/threonine-protein kinase
MVDGLCHRPTRRARQPPCRDWPGWRTSVRFPSAKLLQRLIVSLNRSRREADVDGTPFGRYRLVELLGRGGMGEVWRAHDTGTDRIVAIKLLPTDYSENEDFQRRFRREAHAAARLNTPHVVPIYDYGEIDGRLYVCMRLIDGPDLQTVLADGPLSPGRAVRIIEQVAEALEAAHETGLVHRDVKPSNILLDKNDFAYLIDFGIARALGQTGITKTGFAVGTWSYMAPERFRDGEFGPSSDIYALTCVLYQCLTGQLPFPGSTFEQVAMAHMQDPPPKPSAHRSGMIPPAMDEVIATGLAKHPGRRYQTALGLAADAKAAIAQPMSADSAETIDAEIIDVEIDAEVIDAATTRPGAFESVADRLGVSKSTVVGLGIVAAFAVAILVLVFVVAPIIRHESSSSNTEITSQTPTSTSASVAPTPTSPPTVTVQATPPPTVTSTPGPSVYDQNFISLMTQESWGCTDGTSPLNNDHCAKEMISYAHQICAYSGSPISLIYQNFGVPLFFGPREVRRAIANAQQAYPNCTFAGSY